MIHHLEPARMYISCLLADLYHKIVILWSSAQLRAAKQDTIYYWYTLIIVMSHAKKEKLSIFILKSSK